MSSQPHSTLCTVPRTGSHYLRAHLPVTEIRHTSESEYERCKSFDQVFTAYRDPYRVAASWANNNVNFGIWDHMWYWWDRIVELPHTMVFNLGAGLQHGIVFDGVPRTASEDRLGLHAALNRDDREHFFKHVPEGLCRLT